MSTKSHQSNGLSNNNDTSDFPHTSQSQSQSNSTTLNLASRKKAADLAFNAWSLKKSRYDRGLLLLNSVTDDRMESDPEITYRKVCLSMVATDLALNNLNKPMKDKKTLKKEFYKWCLQRVTFRDLILTEDNVNMFTVGKRTMFLTDDKTRVTTLPSIKYIFPKKKGKGDNAKIALRKALNSDQVASNMLFTMEFRRNWKAASRRLYKVAERELSEEEGGEENNEEAKEEEKRPEKNKNKGEERKTGDRGDDDDDDHDNVDDEEAMTMSHMTFSVSSQRFQSFLYKNGLAVLEAMLAEDEDKAKAKAEEQEKDKITEANQAYEGFVRKKDECKLRMPVEPERVVGGHWKPPRLDFGMGKALMRSRKSAIPTNTVELMRGSGLKYVHALKKGKNGMDMDLEKCKQKLLEAGHVFKENFQPDSDDEEEGKTSAKLFSEEVRRNKSMLVKRAADKSRKVGNKMAFDLWRTKKEMCERALKALFATDKPEHDMDDVKEETDRWIEVGKALKAIDRTLFKEWVKWTDGFQSVYKCATLWDYFPPKCCDVHSSSYSGVRDTFLKLLRPGLDYRSVFEHQCQRKWLKLERLAEDAEEELDDYVMAALNSSERLTKEEAIDMMELNKKDMKQVMRDLGVKLEGEELRRVVDAFDSDGKGTVNKKEFLQFITPEALGEELARLPISVVRGDTSAVLERKCVHETTCCWTGMPNAFVVTTGKPKKKGDKDKDGYGNADEHGVRIVERKDGTTRRIVQLEEREKRWNILKMFNVHEELGSDSLEELDEGRKPYMCELAKWDTMNLFGAAKSSRRDDDDEGGYSDDSDDDHDRNHGKTATSLRVKQQKQALTYLMDLSSENRAALTLKDMMSKGVPPPAPKLWSASVGHPDVGDGLDVLTDTLLLCWRAQPGSLVAFFSLEISGALGSKAQMNNEYTEIYRDPPDANHDASFKFWVDNANGRMKPNTTYSFRIRAFNGFGPGGYTRADFTTQPVKPSTPIVIRAAVNTVTIKWKFGNGKNRNSNNSNNVQFAALRRVFEKLDNESSPVSRRHFLGYLERKCFDVLSFLRETVLSGDNVSLFDAIESHDDDYVTFSELSRYQQLLSDSDDNASASASASDSSNVSLTRTKYVVEQCTSQHTSSYIPIWRGSAGEAALKGLTACTTYRFRVFAINVDGLRGNASDDVVVNTLLDTPNAPKVVQLVSSRNGNNGNGVMVVGSNFVKLTWDLEKVKSNDMRLSLTDNNNNNKGSTGNGKSGLDKVLAEWTKSSSGVDDDGVSLDMVFSQFDRSHNASIKGSNLLALLQDLGVQPSEDRLRDAWQELDTNGDGTVSFSDFAAWWNSKSVTYVLKRDSGVVCYRGSRNSVDVSGLTPNTMYNFQLRVISPNSYSKLSSSRLVHTAPLPPMPPFVVSTNDKDVFLKLHYNVYGGHKFTLQRKLHRSLSSHKSTQITTRKIAEEGWVDTFEGLDPLVKNTGLLPNCIYQYRCKTGNKDGTNSGWSEVIAVTTRDVKVVMKAGNAPEVFTIECTGDVVVGDLVLFTERLFTVDGKLVSGNGNGMTMKSHGNGIVTPRLSVGEGSVSSRSVGGGRRGEEIMKPVQFAGERTVAARVLSKRIGSTTNNSVKTNKKTTIRMACVWSSVSDKRRGGEFVVKEGVVIEREEEGMFAFETFRSKWEDEEVRVCWREEKERERNEALKGKRLNL